MTTTALPPRSLPGLARLSDLLGQLADHAMAAASRAQQAILARLNTSQATGPAPPTAHLMKDFFRYSRAVQWAIILGQLLTGTIALPRRRAHQPAASTPAQQAKRKAPAEQSSGATTVLPPLFTSTMRAALATQSVGTIVEKLCRRLGIAPGTPLWPTDLIAVDLTLADYLEAIPKPPRRTPTPTPAPTPTPRAPLHQPAPPTPTPQACGPPAT